VYDLLSPEQAARLRTDYGAECFRSMCWIAAVAEREAQPQPESTR
jgi:hypothetical protein